MKFKIAFDIELMRPGCVLLQVALGADQATAKPFPAELWLTHPTPGLRVYEVDQTQLNMLVKKVVAHHKEKADESRVPQVV